MAWSVDRLGRNLQDLIGFLSEHALRIDLYLHQLGLKHHSIKPKHKIHAHQRTYLRLGARAEAAEAIAFGRR